MYQTVSFSDFCDAFRAADRNENFSYAAKRALFDWLEDYELSCDEPLELDVIALCCEWSEYDSATEAAEEYGFIAPSQDHGEESDDEYQERCEAEALEWLQDQTRVIECDNGHVIVQAF